MVDVLHKFEEIEEEANAKIDEHWGDEEHCTYDKGHFHQNVYACQTCSKVCKRQFGFCFGCSMNCHVDHEVYELFDKRDFRCDCPTIVLTDHECQLHASVSSINTNNKYNHNFDGLYCWCNKPYDHSSDVVMIQCVLCQDWFHEECIKKGHKYVIPTEEYLNDFICGDCTSKYQFLLYYPQFQITTLSNDATKSNSTTISTTHNTTTSNELKNCQNDGSFNKDSETNAYSNTSSNPKKRKFDTLSNEQASSCKLEASKVLLGDKVSSGHIFATKDWEKELCRCTKCQELYDTLNLNYLFIDEEEDEDPEQKEDNRVSLLRSSEKAFAENLEFQQQVELSYEYKYLSDSLKEFLAEKAKTNTEVTKEDIDEFFENLVQEQQLKKKQRPNPSN